MKDFNWNKLQNGSDIRGVALEGVQGEEVNLTPLVAGILGRAFVVWLEDRTGKPAVELSVSVGRDSRISGPEIMESVLSGISASGCTVYDFGMASTPAMFMSTVIPGFEFNGAIMITASHLPFNRNGMKFFTSRGGLDKQDISDILAVAEAGRFAVPPRPGLIEPCDFISIYTAQLVEKVRQGINHPDTYEQPLQGLKIVVDAGNGAGGFYVDKVLSVLGADTTGSQFLNPDGFFPNHVPNPEDDSAMAAIQQAVLENQADFGIIFDTDVDRAAAVDDQGRALNRNRLIALISAIVLQEHPGSTIVTDSITSDGLTQFIEKNLGGIHQRFKRGYKNVINEAVRLNDDGKASWLAIETSGHAAMRENFFLDDGAYLVSKLVVELAKTRLQGKALTDLIADLNEPVESEEFRLMIKLDDFHEYGLQVIDALRTFSAGQSGWQVVPDNYEGIRISCRDDDQDGWFLLRLSLHDPVLPLNVESNVPGGVSKIVTRLKTFFADFEELDTAVLYFGG
ncbi:MAG: phosphomannomutase/phosphoglucomutase [Anaerolineales bacterium]|nr:phosphomannomutase/phosphoglucomutase [Anaerolineales bacterium]